MSTPHFLTMKMIRDVLRNTGITATAGIGTNLYLAKVAMDIVAKKAPPDQDGVRIAELDELSYRMLLWCHQPLTAFWQIGPGKTRRLAKYGIHTMGDIAQMSIAVEEFLYRLFAIDAEILIDHAWGKEPCTLADIKNYRPKANSRSVGQVLPRLYRFDEARLVYSEMIDQLALDLVTRGVKTKELSFWVSFDPVSLEELPSYEGPVSLDYYGRLHPGHVVGSVRLRTHTSSTIIIDEGQDFGFDDIEEGEILDKLKLMVEDKGSFYVFYDKLQLIQGRKVPSFIEDADCKLTLYRNCRNTENNATTSLRPISERKPKLLDNAVKGIPAKVHYCDDDAMMISELDSILDQYQSEGFRDVVILTVKTEANSVLSGKVQDGKYRKKYTFSTCRKFKGLEAEVVVLIDVDRTTFDDDHVLLFYVGTSRARTRLEILTEMTDEDCQMVLQERLNQDGHVKAPKRKLASALNASASIRKTL